MRFLLGFVIGVLAVVAAGYLFLTRGGMPAAARNAKPLPFEELLASRALHVAMARDADQPSPVPADEQNLLAGAKVYRENCILCHGAPGEQRRSAVARGMFPRPPPLMAPDHGVTDDPVGETHWKVKNGLRLTGMPSFEGALSDTEMWQVSQLLHAANQLPEAVRAAIH